MQFQIQSSVLASVLSRLVAATESKLGNLDKNSSLRIETTPGAVHISAYSGIMDVEAVVPAKTDEPFVVGVTKALCADIVKALPDGEVTFKIKPPYVELKTERSAFRLNTLADIHLLPSHGYSRMSYQTLNMGTFVRALSRVGYCDTDKPLKPYHNVVFIDRELFACTDGLRMGLFPNTAFTCPGMILFNPDTVGRLQKLYRGVTGDGGITSDGSMIFFSAGGVYTGARTLQIDQGYPDFRGILPNDPCPTSQVARRETLDVLRRILLVADSEVCVVRLDFAGEKLTVSCKAQNGGASQESLDIVGEVQGKFHINGAFLVEALAHMEADDVRVEYRGESKPLVVTDGEHRCVIQPKPAY